VDQASERQNEFNLQEPVQRLVEAKRVAGTKYFGSADDSLYSSNCSARAMGPEESFEIMIHPFLNETGQIVDRDDHSSVIEVMKKMACYDKAVSFSGRKYV
jgi:hypothetical protein